MKEFEFFKSCNIFIYNLTICLFLAFTLTGRLNVHAQGIPFDKIEILATKTSPHFYTLTGSAGVDPGHPEGAGGRVGVFVGPEGVFMVDCQYAPLTDKVVAAIRKITNVPIRFLVNTHEHPDHTGGNPNFAKMGAIIFSREEVRDELGRPFPSAVAAAIGKAASDSDPARLPLVTCSQTGTTKVWLNNEIIDLIPVLSAHTDGDIMVRFEHENVIMIGDFYRNYGYPFVDPSHGGTFKGVLAALDTLMSIAGPDTKLVPGRGTMITKADIPPYRDMIIGVWAKVKKMIDEDKSRDEVLAAKLTAPYDAKIPGGITPLPAGLGTSADRFVGTLYAELKGAK